MLYSYETGEAILEATKEELKASEEASAKDGGVGVILVEGRRCYAME